MSMVADRTYDNVVKGGLKIKGKAIAKNKKLINVDKPKPKDVIVVEQPKPEPQLEAADGIQAKIQQVIANDALTPTEKTFRIAQIKRSAKKIDGLLKETHRERVEKFNQKLSKLSEQTDLLNKRAKEFEKTKGLQYRQNRERIKRNQLVTHYTVDTKEGFVPANFKSSKTNRALYTQQNVRTFTDVEDSDIIGKNVLKAIKIDRVGLKRNIANISNAMGFMNKKRFIGPVNIHALETKISTNLEGIGFVFDVDKAADKLQFVKATGNATESMKHMANPNEFGNTAQDGLSNTKQGGSKQENVEATTKPPSVVTRHIDDRQFDLAEIQFYYKHLYGVIVKLIEHKEDFIDKVAVGLDFTNKSVVSEKVVETGRKVELYTFDNELLQRFKIKTNSTSDDMRVQHKDSNEGDDVITRPRLPAELFRRIFGK
ncbi:ribophorin related [Babesia ovis]|uniref:Ribophorin related n=1 Tax=Babesia ovis TaxID=5869 RepID=A0A9W5TA33_BABOV|nr:ribophorin related [Babesia ovis]